MYSVTAALNRSCHSSSSGWARAGQSAIALLLERQSRTRTRQLAAHQRHFVLPRVRHELHVREIPIVVGNADTGRSESSSSACR